MVNRELRLREDREIKETRRAGKAYADGAIVARIRPNQSSPPANRYTVIAGKKIGKAHERNRCKRLVRESIRYLHPEIEHGYDVAIILRGGIAELTGFDVAYDAMVRIFRRARLLAGDPAPLPIPRAAPGDAVPPPDHPDG